jgi:Tat protein translocase TatB subunit
LGLFEIIIILAVALIVLGPERMPEVIRLAVQILREVRTAAHEAMREITDAIEQENPPTNSPTSNPSIRARTAGCP